MAVYPENPEQMLPSKRLTNCLSGAQLTFLPVTSRLHFTAGFHPHQAPPGEIFFPKDGRLLSRTAIIVDDSLLVITRMRSNTKERG
jgi:hypothetical protein